MIKDDRWLSVQWVTGQVTRGRCSDGLGIIIEKRSEALVGIQLGLR